MVTPRAEPGVSKPPISVGEVRIEMSKTRSPISQAATKTRSPETARPANEVGEGSSKTPTTTGDAGLEMSTMRRPDVQFETTACEPTTAMSEMLAGRINCPSTCGVVGSVTSATTNSCPLPNTANDPETETVDVEPSGSSPTGSRHSEGLASRAAAVSKTTTSATRRTVIVIIIIPAILSVPAGREITPLDRKTITSQ